MNDNDLIEILIGRIRAALEQRGWTDVTIAQKPQPEQQGVPSGRSVFIQRLFDYKYGSPGIEREYNEIDGVFNYKETQVIDARFQISALAAQTYDDTLPTALDIIRHVSMGVSSRGSRAVYKANGFNILRVTDVRNNIFTDDEFKFEFMPSFDLVLVTGTEFTDVVPKIDHYVDDIHGV